MKFSSLGSGSSGNATLIASDDTTILLDCGFGVRETERRLTKLGLSASDINALIVTHEHSDHMKGVGAFARKYHCPVYMSHGTYASRDYGELPQLEFVSCGQVFMVGDVRIHPITVPHDAREPLQFVFEYQGRRLGVLTDLGSVSEHVVDAFQNCHGLLVEANHDATMLANGPYPPSLKARVGGQWGHLNNQQTASLLRLLNLSTLEHLVVGHISRKNNSIELAKQALAEFEEHAFCTLFACQDEGFEWLELS